MMSKMGTYLFEKYMFQLLNAMENAYLLPVAADQKRAYRNLRRGMAEAENARQNLNLICKILELRYDTKTIVPTILFIEGNC